MNRSATDVLKILLINSAIRHLTLWSDMWTDTGVKLRLHYHLLPASPFTRLEKKPTLNGQVHVDSGA